MADWTEIYDGQNPDNEDCLTIGDIVVNATATEGSNVYQVDEFAMKYLAENNYNKMVVGFGVRYREIARKGKSNTYECSWQGSPESKVVKNLDEKGRTL